MVVELAPADGGDLNVDAESLLRAVFAALAPGRSLPRRSEWAKDRRFNFGDDRIYSGADGDSLRVSLRWFGAIPGDGVDTHLLLTVGGRITIDVVSGGDYTMSSFAFEIDAPSGELEAAKSALLAAASAKGLATPSAK